MSARPHLRELVEGDVRRDVDRAGPHPLEHLSVTGLDGAMLAETFQTIPGGSVARLRSSRGEQAEVGDQEAADPASAARWISSSA